MSLQADVIIGSVPPARVHRAQTSLLDDLGLHQLADKLRAATPRVRFGGCPIEAGVVLNLADNECVHMNLPTVRHPKPDCGCW